MSTNTTETPRSCLSFDGGEVPLLGVDVRAEVLAGHARATVRQRYRNAEARAVEAIYTFPLPTRAVVTGFSMTVEGRRLEAEVQEKAQALATYDEAILAGHGAALLEQERPNVFTANVGNLLAGEETIIEIEYVEPLRADEGAIRWALPTLVAPRYMPGIPSGDRSGHGAADPTDRVPDADRISPKIGDVEYGLTLDLALDVGAAVDVTSPSHAIVVKQDGLHTRVTFAQRDVPLDRDVVIVAAPRERELLSAVVAHRLDANKPGAFAVTVVPDLEGAEARRDVRSDVVFVIDRSGSMGGVAMDEAKTALKLCLRQLREGDRFGILAFDDSVEAFDAKLVPFTQATLRRADAWLAGIDARGGTELLQPLVRAVELAPSGVVFLLTDGLVGNEAEIEREVMAHATKTQAKGARIHSFGIGTNVSDALLEALARRTGGAVESIHPGERIDEKVITQFARATAPRVEGLTVKLRARDGAAMDVGEIAPAEPVALVDGEPFTVFGTYETEGFGVLEIRGTQGGEKFALDVPIELPRIADRPSVEKLWAQARIRDLEKAAKPETAGERRAESMRKHIVKLAIDHRVASSLTSFVVVEKRTGDRRMNAMPEARPVPVAAPAGWAMTKRGQRGYFTGGPAIMGASPAGARARAIMMPAPKMPAPASMGPMGGQADAGSGMKAKRVAFDARAAVPPPPKPAAKAEEEGRAKMHVDLGRFENLADAEPIDSAALLASQGASGLWEGAGDEATVQRTTAALLALLRDGIGAEHPVYGPQVKKAVLALLALVDRVTVATAVVEVALGVAWLAGSGRRTRRAVEDAVRRRGRELGALRGALADEAALRLYVDLLAPPVP